LQRKVRRKAAYETSLDVLRHVKRARPAMATKSGLMLGLGETPDEVWDTLGDLRAAGVDIVTIGQYLRPSPRHLEVARYVPPGEFAELGRLATRLGFAHVASGPFVRSSYHADEAWMLASGAAGGGHADGR